MQRKIVQTSDGSKTIRIEEWDEQYHSRHGAIAESEHVFIKNGLLQTDRNPISVLEMGFGTGLNALLTAMYAKKKGLQVAYTAIEAYPVSREHWSQLGYAAAMNGPGMEIAFEKMHSSTWGKNIEITDEFRLKKLQCDMALFKQKEAFDLVYFDAFGYRVQPELWEKEVFSNMYWSLKDGGILVTYAAKGLIRRTMQQVGFKVERLEGPPGKREMLRASKV